MLSLRQVEDVCMCDQGSNQCRFLAEDVQTKFYCIKQTAKRSQIDDEVREFKKRHKILGIDVSTLGVPIGDNCKGYTFFRHKKQGYDVPGS